MAHDSQVPREELPEELRERKKDLPNLSDKAQQSLAVLADWWPVLGQIYRDDPTVELGAAWKEVLATIRAEVLHEAILVAIRQSPEFRPKPGRVYEIAETILLRRAGNRPKYLDEPGLSTEERAAEVERPQHQELRKKIMGAG